MDFGKPKTVVKTRHARLSIGVARRIEHIFIRAIAEAKGSDRIGLDGEAYVFSDRSGACAWAWSPEPNSPNDRLVKLMRRLEMHTKFSAPVDLERSEKAIIRYLDEIEGTKN
jgi:hypothetical protein